MELNVNFNKKIKSLINTSESLSDWFERNQDWMAYFDFTHPGCNHFESLDAHIDIKVLGRMADASLSWLETSLPYSKEEKVQNAIMAIAGIYKESKDYLSEVARERYFINVEDLENGMHR